MKCVYYLLLLVFFGSCSNLKVLQHVPYEPLVKIETDSGMMVAKLYSTTPLHRDNFVKHVKDHFYDGLLFHRVIKNFMIQGGDGLSRNAKPGVLLGEGGVKQTIPAEIDSTLFHKKGALGAAREADNVNPDRASSSTQFYIVEGKTYTDAELNEIEGHFNFKIPESHREVYRTIGGSPFLDMTYTVFGQVIYGLEVLDKIANTKTDKNDRPLTDIKMKITLLKKSEYKKYQ